MAGAGAKVAKHGNRSISEQQRECRRAGGAGVRDAAAERSRAAIREIGIGFLFARRCIRDEGPQPVRRALKLRTVFNILGRPTNPAGRGAVDRSAFACGEADGGGAWRARNAPGVRGPRTGRLG